jgi:hypothetical protein
MLSRRGHVERVNIGFNISGWRKSDCDRMVSGIETLEIKAFPIFERMRLAVYAISHIACRAL